MLSYVQWWLIKLLYLTEDLFMDILDTHSAFEMSCVRAGLILSYHLVIVIKWSFYDGLI